MEEGRAERDLLRRLLADAGASFAIGVPAAIAEFLRGAEEAAETAADGLALATPRGAIRLAWPAGARLIAYEAVSRHPGRWQHGLVACLPAPAVAMGRRSAPCELGPDAAALRPAALGARLFDLGLGAAPIDFCVRTAEPALIRLLRRQLGRPLADWPAPALQTLIAAGPERVVVSRFGRIEVAGPIPHARMPLGPHTHLFLERLGPAPKPDPALPLPAGWLVGLQLYPAHPQVDPAGRAQGRFDAFQALLRTWGEPAYVREKARFAAAFAAGAAAPDYEARGAGPALRVALRQMAWRSPGDPRLGAWQARFDPPDG